MSESYLLLRNDGCLWALPGEGLRGVTDGPRGLEVAYGAANLVTQEVVGIVRELSWSPAGSVLQHLLPYGCNGVAVSGGAPVLLIDPAKPPLSLLALEGDPSHGE